MDDFRQKPEDAGVPQDTGFEGPHAYDLPKGAEDFERTASEGADPSLPLGFTELCYGILFHPRETFDRMAENPPVLGGFLIVICLSILQTLSTIFVGIPQTMSRMSMLPNDIPGQAQEIVKFFSSPGFAVMVGIGSLFIGVCWWFINGAILHVVAEMLGGRGRALGVLAVTGVSRLPGVFVIPVSILVYILKGPQGLVSIVAIPLAIYTAIVLPVLGLSRVHRMGTGRAALAVLAPLMLLFAGAFLIAIIVGVTMGIMLPALSGLS